MANPRGAPLPGDLSPADDICMIVHIPNEPAYIAAFNGLYRRLGYWWAWQRDDQHLGRLAAARWRQAVRESEKDWEKWGDLCDMDITVNVNSCCEPINLTVVINNDIHVSQQVINQILALPGGQGDNGSDPPSDDWADYPAYLIDKCASSSQLATDVVNAIESLSDMGLFLSTLSYSSIASIITASFVSQLVGGVLVTALALPGSVIAIVAGLLGMALLGSFTFGYFEKLRAEVNYQELLCAAFDAPDADSAQTAMLAVIDGWLNDALIAAEVNGPGWIALWNNIARILITPAVLEMLFDQTDYVDALPAGDCLLCGGVPPGGGSGMLTALEHAWQFEEASGNRQDSHGTAHLTPAGTPVQVAGAVNFGVELLRAQNDWFTQLGSIVGPYGDQDWAFCLWCRPISMPAAGLVNNRTIIMLGNQNSLNTDFLLYLADDNGVDRFQLWTGGATTSDWHFWNSEHSPTVGEWHMIVAWRDSVADTINIQVNNSGIDSYDLQDSFPTQPQQSFYVGVTPTLTRAWDGDIDQVFLWARNLSVAERTWLWNNGQGRAYSEF